MNIHIVASFLKTDRILPRLARELADATGWTLGEEADPAADLNYYFPYLEMTSKRIPGLAAALFTHREDVIPAKVKMWERHAADVDLRITWARQYEDDLAAYGPTLRLNPPLDRGLFMPGERSVRDRLVAGVSGYTYAGGRKGEELLKRVLSTQAGRAFDWRAVGRGWPVKTQTLAYDRLPAWYRDLDLYVCSSLIEGVPYGPLEALASGVPVVIPHGVGLLDDVPETEGVYRYEAGNAADLEAMLLIALDTLPEHRPDPDALRALTEPYSFGAWADGHLAAFEELTNQTAPQVADAEEREEGIYVVAYGEPARGCALRLLRSIRRHMPSMPVAVASDRPLPGADVHVAHPDADVGGRAAKTKMWSLAPLAWQRVLYLDADTELTAPIPFLFNALRDGWELVMTKDVTAPTNDYDMIHSLWRRDSREYRLGWEAIGHDRALQIAGGVCGFRRTPATQAFLTAWYREWYREARRDQGALLRALYAHPVRLLVLGNEWNTFEGICRETTAGIVHHRGGPARRARGWIPGRLDASEAWARAREEPSSRVLRRVGVAGVIEPRRHYHRQAYRPLAYTGPQPAVRLVGRSGRSYVFKPYEEQVVNAEDAAHIVRGEEQLWRAGDMQCPVCGAPDGACTGDDIEINTEKESGIMPTQERPMRLPRKHSRHGRAGYIGEEEGLVETFEQRRTTGTLNGDRSGIAKQLAALDDEALAELGLQRIPEKPKRRRTAPADKARKTRAADKEEATA